MAERREVLATRPLPALAPGHAVKFGPMSRRYFRVESAGQHNILSMFGCRSLGWEEREAEARGARVVEYGVSCDGPTERAT